MTKTKQTDRMPDTDVAGYREIAALRRSYAFGYERNLAEISDPELLTLLASDCAMVDQ
jgi:hypothetical protein